MRLSSYTFSSSTGYLGTMALAAALIVACAGVLVFAAKAMGRETFANQALLDYQFGKIGKGTAPDIIFVGDSSLGNAIDAGEWTKISGQRALNLALSGSYGYEGTYNMIRRLTDWSAPKHVVVVQTGDMLQRPPSEESYIMTAPGLFGRLLAYWRMSMSAQQVEGAAVWLLSYLRSGKPPPTRESIIVNDYVQQAPQRQPNPNIAPWLPSSIRPDKAAYLNEIGEFCRARGLDCLYVHGPLSGPTCSNSAPYFAEVAKVVERSGLRLVQATPLCVPDDEAGDGRDHIRPDLKAAYTRKYHDIIGPQLRR